MNLMKKILSIKTLVVLLILALVAVTGCFFLGLHRNDYYRLHSAMKSSGYEWDGANYTKTVSDVQINVTFDLEQNVCFKNNYSFDLTNGVIDLFGITYIKGDTLSRITNDSYSYKAGLFVKSSPIEYKSTDWLNQPHLVAHAGGIVRESDDLTTYTNSKEAIVQNYDLGHRVFEFDFSVLADEDNLAVVHDWSQFGRRDGSPCTYDEWMSSLKNVEESASLFTPMVLDNLIDEMIVNRDMYVVTDTKLVGDEASVPIQILVDHITERDPEILNRIIPQVYDDNMYEDIMEIYPFQSVIYTTYNSSDSKEWIMSYICSHDNIQVMTHSTWDERFGEEDRINLQNNGKYVYIHTLNSFSDMALWLRHGADGVYTDELTPEDYLEFEKYKEVDYNVMEE